MSKNDAKVKELMDLIQLKKAALGKRPANLVYKTSGVFNTKKYKTDGVFNTDKIGELININAAGEETLIDFIAFLKNKEMFYNMAAKELGTTSKFEWNSFSIDDYIHDVKLRIAVIQYDAKKTELNTLEKKLTGLLSEDARTEKELDNISKLLGN